MNLPEPLLLDAIKLFSQLLGKADSRQDVFFGLDATIPSLAGDISRAAAQLIEICSWLDFLPLVSHRLKGLCDFLQNQATTNPSDMYSHPSRLKSLLLVGNFDASSMESSINYLLDQHAEYDDRSAITRLAYTDFLGTFVFFSNNNKLPLNFPSDRSLIPRAESIHAMKLAKHWNAIISPRERTNIAPRDYCYTMWLLFLGHYYRGGSRARSYKRHLDYLESRTNHITNDQALQKYRKGEFSHLVYPHIFLFFNSRKFNRPVNINSNYFNWLSLCTKHMLDNLNGYHAGLLIKQFLAIDKYAFRNHLLNNSLSLLIEKQTRQTETTEIEIQSINEAIRKSVTVNVDETRKLTGGWSKASVYRVSAGVHLPLSQIQSDNSDTYVVKIGPSKVLRDAARIYNSLPHEAKSIFAAHNRPIDTGFVGPQGLGYAVIEWLQGFNEFALVLHDSLPQDTTQSARVDKIVRATHTSLSIIKNLHSIPATSISDMDEPAALEVRIANLFQKHDILTRMAPYFAVAIKRGISYESNGTTKRLATGRHTLIQLLHRYYRIPQATYPALYEGRDVIVHGDCHGNNIMLSSDLTTARFIDIGEVHVDDYLMDYAQLVAHVCFAMHLENFSSEELNWFIHPFGSLSQLSSFDKLYPEKWSGINRIWTAIRDHLTEVINERESLGGFRRFSFYLADRLIFIASKSKTPVKAMILFMQGMMILEALAKALETNPDAEELEEISIPPGESVKLLI